MMEAIGLIVSILSWIAPAIREKVERDKSLSDKIDDCLGRAIDQWNVSEELKRSTRLEPIRYKVKLKDYILHPEQGIDPVDKELLQLWADAIMADGDCHAFVIALKVDLIQATQQEGFKKVLSELGKLKEMEQDTNRKVDELLSRGGKDIQQIWDEVSIVEVGKRLPYTIITSGRDQAVAGVKRVCEKPEMVVIEGQSRLEAKAFAAAVLLESGIPDENIIVTEEGDLYNQIVSGKERRVILTSIPANHQVAITNGHSVIYCVGPQENFVEPHIVLPEIDRNGFMSALWVAGIGDSKARQLALDSAKDINMLWRLLGIVQTPPVWESIDAMPKLLPAMLIGRWDEMCDADKDVVAAMAESASYDTYRKELNQFIFVDESPIKRIESVYALKSPYAMFKRYFRYVTDADIARFLELVDIVLEDVDPDAIAKMESNVFQFWKDKRLFSSSLQKGILESLALIALMQEEFQRDNTVEKWLESKFKTFDLQKYLSHKHHILWMAEASPKAFLQFIENDIANGSPIMDELFVVRKEQISLTGEEIFYTELLFCLECIAWDEELLPQVTKILLQLSAYPNDSNYVNRPTNSLKNIYQFVLPCTFASIDKRIAILRGLQRSYPKAVHEVCLAWLKGLNDTVWHPNSYFRWRWLIRKPEQPKRVDRYPRESILREMYELMMLDFGWEEQEMIELLELSMHGYMCCLREEIIGAIRIHMDKLRGNEAICDALRKDVYRHMEYPDTWWAMRENDLQLYKDLLRDMTLPDVVNANKHYFESVFVHDPELGLTPLRDSQFDYGVKMQAKIEGKIMAEKGIEGIWELLDVAKSAEAVANGFTELTGDEHRRLVYEQYCNGEVSEEFTRRYFNNLYYKLGSDAYIGYLKEMQDIQADRIGVVLYAPWFHRELADIAEVQSEAIWTEYWRNVQIWDFKEDDVAMLADRLLYCKRYRELLQFMQKDEVLKVLENSTKGNILYTLFRSDEGCADLVREAYMVGKILSTIDVSGDEDLERKVEQMEFYLYENLEHYLKDEHNHFKKAINTKPEMMMEIVSALYKSDDESEIPKEDLAYRQFKARVAYRFWNKYASVPCVNVDGEIDEAKFRDYIVRLQELAKEQHYESVMPYVIGKILSNFPENDDYPSELLCSMVEEFQCDTIDRIIGDAIHNRRSFSTRSPFEGGTVERHHIATLRAYREKAVMRSTRFVKILDTTIRSFEYSAKREDYEGKMNNLDY